MLVTLAGTVSVSALLWLPMPRLVMRLAPVLDGELQSCAVSLATIAPGIYELQDLIFIDNARTKPGIVYLATTDTLTLVTTANKYVILSGSYFL